MIVKNYTVKYFNNYFIKHAHINEAIVPSLHDCVMGISYLHTIIISGNL